MGWKASAIIINKPEMVEDYSLLSELGFSNLNRIEDEPFEVAINSEPRKVYIGMYMDNLLICLPDVVKYVFEKDVTRLESSLMRNFPKSEICSIALHSGVNLWGYSIVCEGKKIRVSTGNSVEGTHLDYGEPLNEELELRSKSFKNESGQRFYTTDSDGEVLTEDQVGESLVFNISKRYFGDDLDRKDDLLFDTILTGYCYDRFSLKNDRANHNKPWWKIW